MPPNIMPLTNTLVYIIIVISKYLFVLIGIIPSHSNAVNRGDVYEKEGWG